ncbi:MAG: mechanosensitive ion channel [Sedimentisphaerales bacterium]|nr:mechanosensitive ion channel [Sedimentisphaerales bacterium]
MLKWLEPVLPYIHNVASALGVLLAAYLFVSFIRRRIDVLNAVESRLRSGRQFIGVLLSYPAFALFVLVFSTPLIYWLKYVQDLKDWSAYHEVWLLFWGIYAVIRFLEGLLVEGFTQLGRTCPLSRLSRGLLRLAIMLAVAFLLIRFYLNKEISVLLTSTAIVTGVIGFAMQGVLGNLLAGMSLHACRSMSVGDWIEVDGTIGQVTLVNWRETRLRTLGGHVLIIPNGKLADAILRNFTVFNSLRRHEVSVAASYGDAPGDVIAALVEAAQNVPTVEKKPAPDAYVTGFRDFCIEYVLRFWSNQYEQRTMIEGHVMRMIWYKFQRRGIEIPFPMSGRLLDNFLHAVHAQQYEKPLASEIESIVDDLLGSDFGRKLMAGPGGACMLSRDELEAVAKDLKRAKFTYGEVLMRQNEEGESFYVLVRGKVKGCITSADGAPPVEFELQPGALFGEMSLLTGVPRSATMTAQTDCEVLEFDRDAFTRLLSLREEIPRVLSDLAAARARENAEAMEKLRVSATIPPDLAPDGILHRFKRMLGEWRVRREK